MRRRDRDAVGEAAVGHGNPCRRGNRGERRHAGHDLVVDPGLAQHLDLLAPAAEDERVAALQADDVQIASELDEQPVDLCLPETVAADAERIGGRLVDDLLGDEPVVDHGVAGAKPLQPAHRDQARVSGACTDERDAHESSASTSCWK
jgi:hypothetical protein